MQRFYVETVRALLRITVTQATLLCDGGVLQGLWQKHIGYLCPKHGHIFYEPPKKGAFPITATCAVCTEDEEAVTNAHPLTDCQTIVYYEILSSASPASSKEACIQELKAVLRKHDVYPYDACNTGGFGDSSYTSLRSHDFSIEYKDLV